MSETTLVLIFSAIAGWNVLLSGAVVKLLIEQVKTKIAVNIFIDSLGDKLAKALHNDDDHLGLDTLLDKYLDRNYELSFSEWVMLKDHCNKVLNNKDCSQIEKSLAGMLAAVCEHKIGIGQLKPTPKK